METQGIPEDIQRLMDETKDVDVIDQTNVVGFVTGLKQKINENLEMRFQHGDSPGKFMESEESLHNALKQVREISVDHAALKMFYNETSGMSHLLGLLSHQNPDIVSDSLGVLSDFTDPEVIVAVTSNESDSSFADDLLDRGVLDYLAEVLTTFSENQHVNDDSLLNVTLSLQILENLLELDIDQTLLFIRRNRNIVPFLLSQILHQEPLTYNKVFAIELLGSIMQHSPSCALWISSLESEDVGIPRTGNDDDDKADDETDPVITHGLTGVKNFINALAIYRKQDVETAEQEEFVSNAYLCLQISFLNPSSRKLFSQNQGIELMIRMIRGGNMCLVQALRTLSMVLDCDEQHCNLFIDHGGLDKLSEVFMYRGVITKSKGRDAMIDEYTTSVFVSLFRFGSSNTQLKVCMKFVQQKGELIIRLLDSIELYSSKVSKAVEQVQNEIEALKKISEINEEADEDELSYDDRLYLRKCDLGYNALLNCIQIFMNLANSGNSLITKLLIGLQSQHGINPLPCIAFYVEDYISHLCESSKLATEKNILRESLINYLKAYDELLKTDNLTTYQLLISQNETNHENRQVDGGGEASANAVDDDLDI
eukprot:GHVH01001115.1.p1 GENE.GHVH01001115.1~~GHVH01001115.1.p1  ORF type:complete len:598 (+),score=110.52 GHVH01001115.1:41-1834(+)